MFVFHVQQFSCNKCLLSGKDFMLTLYYFLLCSMCLRRTWNCALVCNKLKSTSMANNGRKKVKVTKAYVFTGPVCFLDKARPKTSKTNYAVKVKAVLVSQE